LDEDNDGLVTLDEVVSAGGHTFDQDDDGQVTREEADFYLAGAESVGQEDFAANVWELIRPRVDAKEKEERDRAQAEEEAMRDSLEAPQDEEEEEDIEDYDDLDEDDAPDFSKCFSIN